MMAGNPNWWTMNNGMQPQAHHQLLSSSTYLSPPSSSSHNNSQYLFESSSSLSNQEYPRSWSQLLLGGLGSDQDRLSTNRCEYNRLENWEEHHHHHHGGGGGGGGGVNIPSPLRLPISDVKQEVAAAAQSSQLYGHVNQDHQYHPPQQASASSRLSWPPPPPHHHQVNLVSSPTSCVTSLSNNNNLLNFSSSKANRRSQHADQSTEGNSSSTGGLAKRPRVQHSSVQPALKVRKEKLGDRITALHQLVSPFGKTDTASVLSEAIGYIRFLLGQIEALSCPYMGNVSKSMGHHQHPVQERNCLFPEEPGHQDGQNHHQDLRSRGLCLVPVSCTQHVGSDSGADYWAPSLGGGF